MVSLSNDRTPSPSRRPILSATRGSDARVRRAVRRGERFRSPSRFAEPFAEPSPNRSRRRSPTHLSRTISRTIPLRVMFGLRPPGERREAPASRSRARRPRAPVVGASDGALRTRHLLFGPEDVYERRVYRSRHHDENHDDGDEEQTRARAFGARGVSMHDVSQVELHATDARGGLAGRLGRLRDRRGGWAGSCEARVRRRGHGMKRGRGRAAEATRSGRGGVGRSVDAPVRPCRRRPLRRPRRPTRSGRVVARQVSVYDRRTQGSAS